MSSQTLKSNPTGSKSKSKSNSSESHLKSDSETGHIFPQTKKHARIEADADLAAIEDVTSEDKLLLHRIFGTENEINLLEDKLLIFKYRLDFHWTQNSKGRRMVGLGL